MLISLSVLVPGIFAALIAMSGLISPTRQQEIRRILALAAPAAVVPALVLTLTGDTQTIDVPWMLFGISLSVDDVARILLLVGALLYGAALISISWTRKDHTERSAGILVGFLLACYTGNVGVYLAADAVSFYLFFAIMSFSAAGLIWHYRTAGSYRATRIYLVMTVISETALLAGLFFTVQAGGSSLVDAPDAILASPRTGLILTLLFIGFGIKAGMVPLHIWLPLAYSASPPAAAAVLSGAMSKAGLVGMLRFFPLTATQSAADTAAIVVAFGWVLMGLALLGAFGAILVGVFQHDARVVLAYSSISQMAFMGIVVAAGLINRDLGQDAIDATVMYAAHHGLAKGALFLGLGVLQRYGQGLYGLLATIGMVSAGLALAGAPLSSGGIAKYVSKEAVGTLTIGGIGLEYILPLVATGSIVLLLRLLLIVRTEPRGSQRDMDGQLMAWLGLCLAGIVVPWMMGTQWLPLKLPDWLDFTTLWDATWPIGLGLLLGGAVWWMAQRWWLSVKQPTEALIPAGDLVVVAERVATTLQTDGGDALQRVYGLATQARTRASRTTSNMAQRSRSLLNWLEDRLGLWPRFGATVVVLFTLVVVVGLIFGRGT